LSLVRQSASVGTAAGLCSGKTELLDGWGDQSEIAASPVWKAPDGRMLSFSRIRIFLEESKRGELLRT
jgi:hypothetical protein